jgi:hypothetical protein
LDEIPKPVVVAQLRAGNVVGMEMIIAVSVTPRSTPQGWWGSLRRRDDNSRSKVQNVRKDSSAKDLVEKATKTEPNKKSIEISAKGLKEAVEGIADVVPIAAQIVTTLFSMFRYWPPRLHIA